MIHPDSSLPLVSCIVTNYNYGRFISQALDSLLAQTYANLEIIVVDDGSTDNSPEIISQYQSDITLLTQANQGVVPARNNGAAQAQGQYIFFLDADDFIEPEYVELLVQALQTSTLPNAAVAYCDFQFAGQITQTVKASPWNPRKLLYRNYIIAAALIKKSAFDAVGGFDVAVNQKASFEDWDLWLSLLQAGYQGVYVPQVLFHYRLHGSGRNQAALKQRGSLEHVLHAKHASLYTHPFNRLYLLIFQSASRLRNTLHRPPGT